GKYDGVVGVLGGLEAIRLLRGNTFRPKHSIDLLIFASQEPTRFGIGCLRSRLLFGSMASEAARKLTDEDGQSIEEVRGKSDEGTTRRSETPGRHYKAFLELPIELRKVWRLWPRFPFTRVVNGGGQFAASKLRAFA